MNKKTDIFEFYIIFYNKKINIKIANDTLTNQKMLEEINDISQNINFKMSQKQQNQTINIDKLQKELSLVINQQDNTEQIIKRIKLWSNIKEKERPLNFFLVGTSGVGKTFSATQVQKAMKHLGYQFVEFPMIQYKEKHSVSNIFGSPTGYVGGEPKLFNKLKESNGKLIILFDEIEKAHKDILTSLMQILDKGFATYESEEGDFRECIIFFTSNLAQNKFVNLKREYINILDLNNLSNRKRKSEFLKLQNDAKDLLISNNILPELTGRLNNILIYNPLPAKAIISILFQKISLLASKSYNLNVIYISPTFLAEEANNLANNIRGVRPLNDLVEEYFQDLFLDFNNNNSDDRNINLDIIIEFDLEKDEFYIKKKSKINIIDFSYNSMIKSAINLLEKQ